MSPSLGHFVMATLENRFNVCEMGALNCQSAQCVLNLPQWQYSTMQGILAVFQVVACFHIFSFRGHMMQNTVQ